MTEPDLAVATQDDELIEATDNSGEIGQPPVDQDPSVPIIGDVDSLDEDYLAGLGVAQ